MTEKYPINPKRTIMLGIDWQLAFGGIIPVPKASEALENAKFALNLWRPMGKVVLTRHIFKNPSEVGRLADSIPNVHQVLGSDSPDAILYPDVFQDGDTLLDKTRFNALIGTDLSDTLEREDIDTVVVCGLTTPICVQATIDGLMMSNRKVILLEDACASQAMGNIGPEDAHQNALQRMNSLLAEVITTDSFANRIS